jgi:hypothetical protein
MNFRPNKTIVATIAGPLNPPILGDFEASTARKSPRIGGLGGGSSGSVAPISRFGIRPLSIALLCGAFVLGIADGALADNYQCQPDPSQSHSPPSPPVTAPDLARAIEQLNNADAKVRLAGISALSAMGESAKEATPQLILLLKDSSPTVRSSAASALGIVGVEVAGTAAQLEQIMKDDPNPEVRKAASEALEYLYYIDHERIRGL